MSLFLAVGAQGQVTYKGSVYDAVTLEDVVNADVTLKSQNVAVRTNPLGNFILTYGEENEGSPIRFKDNTVIWNSLVDAELTVFDLKGQQHAEHDMHQGDLYNMPQLPNGLYVLQVSMAGNLSNYKIASNGSRTVMVDKKGVVYDSNINLETDTLLVKKEGYASVAVGVDGSREGIDIPLLKEAYDDLDYLNNLLTPIAFEAMSNSPARSNLGDVKSVKIIYDIESDILYYMNSKKHEQHFGFAFVVLEFNQGRGIFNQTQYTHNPARYLDLGSVNYYSAINKYVLQFVSATEMTCEEIDRLYNKILQTSFLEEDLFFFPIKKSWEACSNVQSISSEELYQGQTFQGLNLASNYGYLRKISAQALPRTFLNRRDIVLTDGVPNDIPVVAGIITSEFQTPLSHINVLSNSRNTPNMALRGAWDDPVLESLEGSLVFLDVKADAYDIRVATIEEATSFWAQNEPQTEVVLNKNTDYRTLIDMVDADVSFLDKIGGKAATFAEVLNVEDDIPTPENSFAIPFFYYEQHMEKYGLNEYLESLFELSDFKGSASFRDMALADVRDSIMRSPIDPNLVDMVAARISQFEHFSAFRFRSSTNAEDLEDFSGAGLYSSHSAKKDHDSKTIESAIRKVWASLWNWRAFEERAYFKINHMSCAMGILVHRSFPDEDANGVLVTKNLYNSNPGFIINVQYKEYSIVFPDPGIIHDQIMLFTEAIDPEDEFIIEYLTFSNVPGLGGERVMTDEEIFELGRYAKKIKDRFYYDLSHDCNCSYDDFGVDIEFKVDSQVSDRKIYVKQARLFK